METLRPLFFATAAFADQFVRGYTRSNGTVVQSYHRSSPNGTVTDNFSYKGNLNPYTGAIGTNHYIHDKTSPYYQGPDSHGRVGHSGAPLQPEGYGASNSVSLNQRGFEPLPDVKFDVAKLSLERMSLEYSA